MKNKQKGQGAVVELGEIPIIFEDQDLLIINKPAGLVVNKATTLSEPTIQDWVTERLESGESLPESEWEKLVPEDFSAEFGTSQEIFEQRSGIVHRLDRETSGLLVLAKNPGSLVNLLSQFKKRHVKKTYRCLAHGKFNRTEGRIVAPIGRLARNRQLFGVVEGGRSAETKYRVEQFFASLDYQKIEIEPLNKFRHQADRIYQGFSLVTCWPKTGRTHQIRVHLKHEQHALVGDSQYVGKKRQKLDKVWCPRHFLHASSIAFTHPRTNQPVSFDGPLAPDLISALGKLEKLEPDVKS